MKALLAFSLLALLVSCRREDDFWQGLATQSGNPGAIFSACYKEGARNNKNNYRLVMQDEFNGPSDPSEAGNAHCFTRRPNCSYRLDWFSTGNCRDEHLSELSHLGDLNKCRWTVYNGWSFWGKDKSISTFSPKMVEIKNGTVRFYVEAKSPQEMPDSSIKCGPKSPADDYSWNYFNTDCPVKMGGLHTNIDPSTGHPGFTIGPNSRVEVRARFSREKFGYAALWMWPAAEQNFPGLVPRFNNAPMEIDIMESNTNDSPANVFQTVHSWFSAPFKSASGETILSGPHDEWAVYGMEWDNDEIRFFVDDCYNVKIKDGEKDARGNPVRINNVPEFMTMSMGEAMKDRHSIGYGESNRRFMEVDWIRVYQK